MWFNRNMLENYPSLLITKLYIPRLRSSLVTRAALLSTLDTDRKLTLVAAAAGFGKTTLVAAWSASHPTCWVSLDHGDNDVTRFLSYLVAAIQTRHPHIGRELLAALQSPQAPTIDNAMHILINQLAALPERLVLVLDDYHVIDNPTIHAALTFLLDYLPPQLRVVLLTRADPPLPLARLRVRNELLELRAADLRFSIDEIAQFLSDLNLTKQDLHALENRTEGWIAGLQLAAVALQKGDKQAFIQNFTGSHRFILDYLIEEVLAHQPENVRHFLLYTSILHRMNGALCSTITGLDGQTMLEYLEKNNLFIVPLDHWYRYHHLFADLLQARLHAEVAPAFIDELRQRAARWHENNNLPEEAVGYALAARDFDYAAHLITGPAINITRRAAITTLLNWYKAFPHDVIIKNAHLGLQFGLAFALAGRWNEAESLLAIVEQSPDHRLDETLLLAYLVATYHQDINRLQTIAHEAAVNRDRVTTLVLALIVSLGGNLRDAADLMAQAQDMAERDGDSSLTLNALFHRTRFHVFLGDLHHAHDLCQTALKQANNLDLSMITFVHISFGRILIEWNELDRAADHLTEAVRLAELSGFLTGIVSSATIMLAEVKQAQGDSEAANQLARTALSYAERYDPPAEAFALRTYQARLWTSQGNIPAAVEWLHTYQNQPSSVSLFYPTAIHRMTQARVLLAQRKFAEAIALLTAEEPSNLLTVEKLVLLALARSAQGDSVHALLTLERALTLAETENRIHVFLELNAGKLLARFYEEHPENEFVRKLLSLFSDHPNQTIDPLSQRELEILRLIVAGHSNEEIAQTLTLAMSTVKWYINTLYAKLHVKTRAQAVARAYTLRILND